MKSVASLDELRRSALAIGASVEVGGAKFNAAQLRADLRPKPAPVAPPAFAPAPVEAESPDADRAIATAITAASAANFEGMRQLAQRLDALLSRPAEREEPPRAYTFTVRRGADGLIESVTATPN